MNLKNDSHQISILLCFDTNYADFAAIATYSAHKNAKSPLIFYWMATADSKERAEKLKQHLQKFGIEIELHILNLSDIFDWKTGYHFTTANYLRLFAPDLLSNVDKVIYIDCDTLVLTDLSDLYNHQLSGSHFAGVIDEVGARTSKVPRDAKDNYINSGVLLMDLKGLRDHGFLQRSKALYAEYEKLITWADQCLINKYAEGKKIILDPKWNRQIYAQSIKERDFIELTNYEVTSILHFVGSTKPWQQWCDPTISEFWWKYAKDLQIEDLKPTQISKIEQVIELGNVMHLNEHYERASSIKSDAIKFLVEHIKKLKPHIAENRRLTISEDLNNTYDGIVRHGPFKGFKFSKNSWWGGADRANMLLGLYEQEVLISLQQLPKKYPYFVDVGAADGYYGVGVIVGGLFERSWCYEASEQGRKTIEANARINNVADQIIIKGKVDCNFYKDFSQNEADQSVLFVDIEGGEFEIFNSELFEKFKNSVIFIELHDWFFPDGKERLNRLKNEAEKYFKITSLTTTSRDLSVFEELRKMSDTDRWLICSEGRGQLMTWWRLDPI